MRKMMNNTMSNKETPVSFYEILEKYIILNESEKNVVRPSIQEKIKTLKGKEIPFRNKNMTMEEKVLTAKKSYISENFFNMEMYELERTFKDAIRDNINEYIFESDSPMEKANRIYQYTIILEEDFTAYEKSVDEIWKELNFLHLYATFLCLLDELKGTIYEKDIKNYTFLFENIFSFK